MSLAYYTMDDLRLGRGGFLQKGWTIRQRPELGEALARELREQTAGKHKGGA